MVQTVLGELALSAVQYCQTHEHVWLQKSPASEKNPALLMDEEEKSAGELQRFRQAGGCTLVDCQPWGAGRNASALRRLSLASGVQIVAVTGYHMPLFYPKDHPCQVDTEEQLYAQFVKELTQGIQDEADAGQPPILAGAVKAAIGEDGASGRFAIQLRAAARAAALAKVPLILHTEFGRGAVEAVALCVRLGVPPHRLLVCHVDRQAGDFGIHEAVAKTGAMLEYDTIARFKYHDNESEIQLIRHMLDKGYEKQLLLSMDTTRQRMLQYGGDVGLDYILTQFLPMLRKSGLREEQLFQITVTNPATVFA